MKRQIIKIDEEKCNGCGACIPSCKEGAIQIVNGKAKLVDENICDGLGHCLGTCPMDAITIEERDVAPKLGCGCPGTMARSLKPRTEQECASEKQSSELAQWPVQLALIPTGAPYLKNADLIILADCTAVAYASLHHDFIRNRIVAIACPKLDDTSKYVDKLAEIIRLNDLRSLEVVMMEVPCCSGLGAIVDSALKQSGENLVIKKRHISIEGNLISE